MTNIDSRPTRPMLAMMRRSARGGGHMQHAQMMLAAAGLAALTIVAVAAAMMVSLGYFLRCRASPLKAMVPFWRKPR